MKSDKPKAMDLFDPYFSGFPDDIRTRLVLIALWVLQEAPEARATLKYKMPGYEYKGYLIHFSAYKNHIGLYAIPNEHPHFVEKLKAYKTGSGSMQILHSQELPEALIREMIRFNLHKNNHK
jgi:uncharacterized protein YdhG (YjbR/CyaY superfamily)